MVQGETGIPGCVSQPVQVHGSWFTITFSAYVFGKDAPTQSITPNSPLGLKSLELISMRSCPPYPGLSSLFVGLLFLYQIL